MLRKTNNQVSRKGRLAGLSQQMEGDFHKKPMHSGDGHVIKGTHKLSNGHPGEATPPAPIRKRMCHIAHEGNADEVLRLHCAPGQKHPMSPNRNAKSSRHVWNL